MINEKVIHKSWGDGVINNFEGETITATFDSVGEKKLQFPIAFEKGFLKMEDANKQFEIMGDIEKLGKEEAERKAIEKAEKEDAARARLEAAKNKPKPTSTGSYAPSVKEISELKVGFVYKNDDLREAFKVSPQGGMRKSNTTNSLVLISKYSNDPEKNPYEDKWEADGFFHYTGMGLEGDQDLNYKQNRTLNESNKNGVNVYLFESYATNEYTYRGEVVLAKAAYAINEQDTNNRIRKVYKFPLKLVD
ncbi:MAG TPA: hypothetical protein VGC17_01275 [Lactovum miscens]|uniref:hypothetical protein n=1 Tax=Lactovum miscens TaxID=190387 RepID=UPI002EDB6176